MTVEDFSADYVTASANACCGAQAEVPTKSQVRKELRTAFPLIGWLKLAYWTWWIIREIRKRLKNR